MLNDHCLILCSVKSTAIYLVFNSRYLISKLAS